MSAPTTPATPLGAKEEAVIQNYFTLLSQFAFDKAKELMEKERDAHKAIFGSSWALLVHSLINFAAVEKQYMGLGFLEQKWFSRSKDTLRNSYQVLLGELRRVEEGVNQHDQQGLLLPGPTMEFEQLLSHLCGQICHFLKARQKTMDFYEQISAMATNKNINFEDLVMVITEIIQCHKKNFHHPLISCLKSSFTFECEVINHLLNAQILMSEWQFLPSLLQLHQAHSKLISWGSAAQARETTKKSAFGGSSKSIAWPSLYQWLLKYKCLLVAKFSLYFYEILAKQTVPSEMKSLCARNTEDFVAKVQAFQKKTDAVNISLVLDIQGIEHQYKGAGYHHPNKQIGTPTGLDSYPAIFSYPQERPPNHWPNVVMLISDRLTEQFPAEKLHWLYDRHVQSTYFMTKVDTRISLVVIFESKKAEKDSYVNSFMTDLGTQLRCLKLFSTLKPGTRGK